MREHGVVLESGRGPRGMETVPSLAEAIAGGPIRGSWWSHPKGRAIFAATRAVADDPDVLLCRAVGGKRTFVHRRLWPALVRLAARFPRADLARLREEHTASGAHRVVREPFPRWVPREVARAAKALTLERAEAAWKDACAGTGRRARSGSMRRTSRAATHFGGPAARSTRG